MIASNVSTSATVLDSLYRYALVLTRNQAEAEDLVQETYVRAIGAAGRLQVDSNIRAWLFTILRNLRLNAVRKLRTDPKLLKDQEDGYLLDGLVGNMPDAHNLLEQQQDAELVRSAIRKLPSEFQEVLILREFEELSYQEIASVLHCPMGTVMSRLGRARAKLRRVLTAEAQKSLQSRSRHAVVGVG